MYKSLESQLMDRLSENYEDFKSSLNGVSRTYLFNYAPRIAIVTEVYKYLTKEHMWDCDGDIEMLLVLKNPLTLIADEWEKCRREHADNIDFALLSALANDSYLTEYPITKSAYGGIYIDFGEARKYEYFL